MPLFSVTDEMVFDALYIMKSDLQLYIYLHLIFFLHLK